MLPRPLLRSIAALRASLLNKTDDFISNETCVEKNQFIREASHIDFVHEKRHVRFSEDPQPPTPTLETSHIVIDILFNIVHIR
jgi:hypothetical protein